MRNPSELIPRASLVGRELVLRCTLFQVSLASDAGDRLLKLVATLIAGAALLSSAGVANAACSRSDYSITPSQNSRAKVLMTASSGMDCVVRLAPSRRFTVTERRISEKPGHGTVTIEGETAFYRSVPGYRGPDRFAAEVSATGSDGQGTSTIVVDVVVK